MARIRTIKPETCESESLAVLPLAVCFTFVCLWPHCDDRGRRKAQPLLVKADLYPLREDITADDITEHLTLLAEEDTVCLYTGCDGKPYLHIVNWDEHQKVDRPSKSRIPPCRVHEPDSECAKHDGPCTSSTLTLEEPPDPVMHPRESASREVEVASPRPRTLDLGSRTVDLGPGTVDLASKRRDETWDALLAACGVDQITDSARGAYNRASKDLRDLKAEPLEIRRRAAVFRQRWPTASLTPTALVRRWGECSEVPASISPSDQRAAQAAALADRYRAQES